MSRRPPALRPAFAALLLALTSLLSCGREVTGPGGRGRLAEVQLNPVFPELRLAGSGEVLSIGSVVDFASVRLVLVRTNGDTVVDRVVPFPADSTSIELRLNVVLSDAATPQGEPFAAAMRYIAANGDTVFSAGPVAVVGRPVGSTPVPPPTIPLRYVGPGADAASLVMTPTAFTGTINQQVTFSSVVRDSANAVITTVPVAYTSTDSARVRVDLRTGAATLLGARGTALIVGQTLTGPADTSVVTITPTASAIALVSGNNQQVRQGSPFPQPVRVVVRAVDNLPVEGVPVAFTVLSGQGLVSQAVDTTDAAGLAEVTWTAGDSAGTAQLRAQVVGNPALAATATGQQLSSAPTTLTFETQPVDITAGDTLPRITVVVRDATGDTVRAYAGPVELALAGGTAGAALAGYEPLQASGGVVTFVGLTVDRGGTGYRLVAAVPNGGPTAQSNAFNAQPTRPANVTVVRGGGQSVPPATVYPDSVTVRVTDRFGFPKAGVQVGWAIFSGGGFVSPGTSVTDADGRASTQWTAGLVGTQELRATPDGLASVSVFGTVIASGGPPVLFLSTDTTRVPVGLARPVTVFLSNPTPTPLTVDFTMRDAIATWGAAQLTIPAGGASVTAQVTGVTVGVTRGVVSSAAGTDSVTFVVDSLGASIEGPTLFQMSVSDTVRTVVRLEEPAPAGGLTVRVVSTDSSLVLVAPGSGLGAQENPCATCGGDLRAEGPAEAALVAPPAGTATLTIPEGQLTGHLVILPIAAPGQELAVPLALEIPGYATRGVNVYPLTPSLTAYCASCAMGPEQRDDLTLYLDRAVRRDVAVRLRSLTPAVVQPVDSVAVISRGFSYFQGEAYVIGADTGIGLIEVAAAGFPTDTLAYRVWPGALIADGGLFLQTGTTATTSVNTAYDDGALRTGLWLGRPLTVTATVRDPQVLRLEWNARAVPADERWTDFTYVATGVGSTWVVYSAPGYRPDSALFTAQASTLTAGAPGGIGLGLQGYVQVRPSGGLALADPVTLTARVDDPTIARVLTPTLIVPRGGSETIVQLEGIRSGTTNVIVHRSPSDSVVTAVTVTRPQYQLYNYTFPTTLPADGTPQTMLVYLGTGGYYQGPMERRTAILRSTNPAALQVSDSLLVFEPGAYYSVSGVVRPVAAGTAQLVVVPNDSTIGDTSAVVTVTPPRLTLAGPVTIGTQTVGEVWLNRVAPAATALPVTLSLSGPSGASLVQLVDTIPAGQSSVAVRVRGGATLGIDTLTATADGFAPVTTTISVTRPRLALANPYQIVRGEDVPYIGAFIYAPNFTIRAPSTDRAFRLVSRDTSIVRVLVDSITFRADSTYPLSGATVRGELPGQTWLVVESLDGSVDPDSGIVYVRQPQLYMPYGEGLTIGMQQRSYRGQVYIERGTSRAPALWVRLRNSAPGLVTVPDSVLLAEGEYEANVDVVAHDTTGAARITFEAPGFSGGEFTVHVTRSELDIYWGYDDVVPGGGTRIRAYARTQSYYAFPLAVNVPLALSTGDTAVAAWESATATLMADSLWEQDIGRIVGRRPGSTFLQVDDARTGFTRLVGARVALPVYPGALRFSDVRYSVAAGTARDGFEFVYNTYGVDSTWVRVRALHGRAAVTQDSILLENDGDYYGAFTLRGIAAGVDTLVVEGAGMIGDTVLVYVDPGQLRLVPLPSTLVQGDSVAVTLSLGMDASFDLVSPALAPLTVTLAAPPNAAAVVNGAVVTQVVVPVGASSTTFWLRGLTPGVGTFTLSAPGFTATSYSVSTRTP